MKIKQKRILVIGAHPDDSDILCGGTAIKLISAGHVVKFVSATTGDTGHHILSREETAKVRFKETQNSAKLAALYEYEVLNNPCGLEPTLEKRKEFVRLIRNFRPDIVISHRLCDYHPDHRATSQLVLDTAYVVMVPHFCEDTPIPNVTPIYAYSFDHFQEPRIHRADAIVEFESVLDKKLALLDCHKSQFYEWLPWADGDKNFDPKQLNEISRKEHLLKWMARFTNACNENRKLLIEVYGKERGEKIKYAETFEQSAYSRQIPQKEFQAFLCED